MRDHFRSLGIACIALFVAVWPFIAASSAKANESARSNDAGNSEFGLSHNQADDDDGAPGPILGAGLPGLAMLGGGYLVYRLKRRKKA